MSTNCKILFGYNGHDGWFEHTDAYYRHYDGYTEAMIPLLKEFTSAEKGVDIDAINENAKYDGHKFEKLEHIYDGVTRPEFVYLINDSDYGNIRCTVLEDDLEFSMKYGFSNYKVKMELVL